MKIVVLCGGISTEREISIISGTQVCLALRKKGHRAILLDVFCGDERIKNAGPDSFPEEYTMRRFHNLPLPYQARSNPGLFFWKG